MWVIKDIRCPTVYDKLYADYIVIHGRLYCESVKSLDIYCNTVRMESCGLVVTNVSVDMVACHSYGKKKQR